jgi:hypothetical protein
LRHQRRFGSAKENAMSSFHWFAKLAGSAAIAAMIIPSYSFAESSGGTGGGGASTKGEVTPLHNDSAGTNPATDTEIRGTTDSKAGVSARHTKAAPLAKTAAPIGTPTGRKHVRAVSPETSGGSARDGATGSSMENCMAAWDEKTHMSQDRWRETCARTLDENL